MIVPFACDGGWEMIKLTQEPKFLTETTTGLQMVHHMEPVHIYKKLDTVCGTCTLDLTVCRDRGGLGGGEMTSCVAICLLQDSRDRIKLNLCYSVSP